MLVCRLSALLLLFANITSATDTDSSSVAPNKGYDNLVDWVRRNGGRVDKRLGIAMHEHNGEVFRGGVAHGDIPAGTELLFYPWSLVFGTEGDTATVPPDHCGILRAYATEVEAGESSFWYPYLSMDGSLQTRIPSVWHASVLDELQGLPPAADSMQSSLTDWFSQTCADGKPFTEMEGSMQQSLLAAVTRSAGMRFLPIFDLLQHHNGNLNTKSHASKEGNTVTSAKYISDGEEIFNSYRGERTTSSDIFRRYGFVESWPQQWAWIDIATSEEVRFLLLPDGYVAIAPSDSMTSHIGQEASPTLREFQDEVEEHNMNLSAEQVTQFDTAGRSLLKSLPTTVEEDATVVSDLEHELALRSAAASGNNVDDINTLKDRISAITYRMQFKEAVVISLRVSSALLKERGSGGEL
mmetsp:Transcript_13588/g.29544  ORF Transcript_13588/g.29544 Transcript_13588/m.29544 type:complete len:411 (+) Transcript_13588:177-1409(+)